MAWEVDDIEAVVSGLKERGVVFEDYDLPGLKTIDGIAQISGNYPSKGGKGERGAWFRRQRGQHGRSRTAAPVRAAAAREDRARQRRWTRQAPLRAFATQYSREWGPIDGRVEAGETMKKTCPRCEARVSERAARCRHCGYYFPEKASPWAAGPAYGVGFPLVLMGVFILFLAGSSNGLTIIGAVMTFAGLLAFFHPR